MLNKRNRGEERDIRHRRIRRKITGTVERPRLTVFKSHKNIFVQLIDDVGGKTLASASTLESELRGSLSARGNIAAAKAIAALVAGRGAAQGIKRVVFDRGGSKYHGAVKVLADTARASGLEF
jgi:large subunit ribosomal protein L18